MPSNRTMPEFPTIHSAREKAMAQNLPMRSEMSPPGRVQGRMRHDKQRDLGGMREGRGKGRTRDGEEEGGG
jgi:hypothetical protein